jgi:polyhydroxybutyrate depolymerase
MKKTLCLLSVTFFVLFASNIYGQLISDSVVVDGHYRTFHFNTPTLKSRAALVFVLHGSGGSGKGIMTSTVKLEQQAKKDNALVVYPDGFKKYWNECRKAANSQANLENVDELAFFDSMIKFFKENYGVDDQKVFVVGTSGGGHMAYKLALLMPEKLKGITAIIANLPDAANMDCVESKTPRAIPVMIVNGTADPLNKYEGGMMQAGDFIMGTLRSTDETFLYWATVAGYEGKAVKSSVPDRDPADGKIIERYTYKKNNKPEVVLLKVIGGKHDYPNDIDVHLEAWEFFKRQL